ncbi:superinfection immunity protein [Flexivirga alba]|uniref:Superinfection immunity protein n=1 Tax=Flexivirga alba TaxID=702742 RepID=A0ABW2AED3_9MICO
MSQHDGPSDDATQPVRLRKDAQPEHTERIPTTPETERFQRPPEQSFYNTPPGHYGSPPPAPAPVQQQQPLPPQGPPGPQYPMQPYAPVPMGGPPAYNSVVMTGRPGPSGVVVAIAWILAVCTFFYLLPWAIAATRNKSNQGGIFLVNFFLGWSFVGWVIALVMACGTDQQTNVVVVNQSSQQHYYR